MANRYDLISDFPGRGDDGSLQVSSYWLMAVFRLATPDTFSRETMSSVLTDASRGAEVVGTPLLITDATHLQTENNKDSHLQGLSAVIPYGDINYLLEVLPGDWLMCWIVNSQKKFEKLQQRVTALLPCNRFDDGLKFVGRVTSLGETEVVSETSKDIGYQLQGQGFKEFDATLFYDQHLVRSLPGVPEWLGNLGTSLNALMDANENGISSQKAIPFFLQTLLGKGVPATFGQSQQDVNDGVPPAVHGSVVTPADPAPYAYLVPAQVGAVLGVTADAGRPSPVLNYADLLDVVIGIQNYSGQGQASPKKAMWKPDGLTFDGNIKSTSTHLYGLFPVDMVDFTNKPVWSVLGQYLNQALNEMYTTLRVNEHGSVVPTLVVRQIPFTTPLFAGSKYFSSGGVEQEVPHHTEMLELPRWVADPLLVRSSKVTRDTAARINFVYVYGTADLKNHKDPVAFQILQAPPISDNTDIKLNGLAPYNSTLAVAPDEIQLGAAKKWIPLIADMNIGNHLKLTGTYNLYGQQAPIAAGDNFEVKGIVYQIESVLHTCSIADREKSFMTTLTLVNGVPSEDSWPQAPTDLEKLYVGMTSRSTLALANLPGLGYDSQDLQKKPSRA